MSKPSPDRCPFCHLRDIAGVRRTGSSRGIPCAVFEPLNPVTPGHLLVIPVEHATSASASPRLAAAAMEVAAIVAKEAGQANLITSIGPYATQTVRHLHVHVVPRREGDGLLLPWSPLPRDVDKDLATYLCCAGVIGDGHTLICAAEGMGTGTGGVEISPRYRRKHKK